MEDSTEYKTSEEMGINFNLIVEGDVEVEYGVVVMILREGSADPFREINKEALEQAIAEAVKASLLPGQRAWVQSTE